MWLIRDKKTKVVNYAFREMPKIGRFLKYPIMALDINHDTHEIIKGVPPKGFVAGESVFDKDWSSLDTSEKEKKVDIKLEALKELKEAKAAQDGKNLSMSYLDKRLEAIEKYLGVI